MDSKAREAAKELFSRHSVSGSKQPRIDIPLSRMPEAPIVPAEDLMRD
jgi:hypothetical protein